MQDTSTPLPGTFQSIVPVVDEILAVLVNHANSDRAVSNVEASDAVAVKVSERCCNSVFALLCVHGLTFGQARELHNMMEGMKRAAMDLPGGHLRTDQLERLSEVLDIEAAKRE